MISNQLNILDDIRHKSLSRLGSLLVSVIFENFFQIPKRGTGKRNRDPG